MFQSVADGIATLGLGSLGFNTGSWIADGATNAAAYLLQGFWVVVNQIAYVTGS